MTRRTVLPLSGRPSPLFSASGHPVRRTFPFAPAFAPVSAPALLLLAAMAAAAVPGAAHAAAGTPQPGLPDPHAQYDLQEMNDGDAWTFTGGPYLWMAGIRGNVGHRSTGTAFMKSDFNDIARHLDGAVMGMGEARRGPVSLLMDVMYIKTTTGSDLPAGAPAKHLSVDSKSASGFAGGSYTVLGDAANRLDIAGGVRVWYSSTDLGLHGGPAGGLSGADRATWADAMGGLRTQLALSGGVWLSSWALAGGGQSRLGWDAAALVGWDFLPGFSAVAGYRAMGVDYRHDGFVYDVVQQGPMLGLSGHF